MDAGRKHPLPFPNLVETPGQNFPPYRRHGKNPTSLGRRTEPGIAAHQHAFDWHDATKLDQTDQDHARESLKYAVLESQLERKVLPLSMFFSFGGAPKDTQLASIGE
jgi:hypothetical protein